MLFVAQFKLKSFFYLDNIVATFYAFYFIML